MLITLSFISTLGNILIFLLVLSLVICIHELGHLYFAKKAGILCHEFSFGMGPKLWSTKKGETTYSIRAIPFGGFVAMSGEELEEELVKIGQEIRLGFNEDGLVEKIILNRNNPNYRDLLAVTVESMDLRTDNALYINEYKVKDDAFYVFDKKEMQITPSSRSYTGKTKWQRFLTIFGGPMMNFVLAFFFFLIIALVSGVPNTDSTIIGEVSPGSPAYEVILPDDKVVSINGVEISSWSGELNSISSELGKTIDGYDIVVERNGELITLPTIYPTLNFIGLGFSGSAQNSELIIDRPLYNVTELVAGDKIIAINDQQMNNWEDVIAFSDANKAGSIDKEDLFKITVFRQYKSSVKGEVISIDLVEGKYHIHIVPIEEGEAIAYQYILDAEETL
ncbi:MAG TPA: site-2 protease family protein, partial [Bacillota bacterium]|nr:site-2 protease family protein [Bacillota bacterium]